MSKRIEARISAELRKKCASCGHVYRRSTPAMSESRSGTCKYCGKAVTDCEKLYTVEYNCGCGRSYVLSSLDGLPEFLICSDGISRACLDTFYLYQGGNVWEECKDQDLIEERGYRRIVPLRGGTMTGSRTAILSTFR